MEKYKKREWYWERHKDFHVVRHYDLRQEYIALIGYIFIIGDVYNILDNYNVFRKFIFIGED